jgi:hypothetical protein
MIANKDGRIVETATEARQAEPGFSILAVLNFSIALAAIALSVVWFIFFRTELPNHTGGGAGSGVVQSK